MAVHKKLEPYLNASKHGYAHGLRERLKKGLINQDEAKQELKQRPDYQEIMNILRVLA